MIKLARIFQDGMVLQRQKPIRIWGETDRAQRLSVRLNEEAVFEGEFAAGEFSLSLPPREAARDLTLTLSGEAETLALRRVDIGEVWIAGGQSNMEFPLRFDAEADAVIPPANDAHLRFYDVGKYSFDGEEAEGFKDAGGMDKWLEFKPENAGYFSAVGLYFAEDLRAALDVPVGIVGCNWGGTTASAWLDESYLRGNQRLSSYLDEYEAAVEKLDIPKYEKRGREARRLLASEPAVRMVENMMRGTPRFTETLRALPAAIKAIAFILTKGPVDPNRPGGLYRMMVRKIAGYSCRGVIWYQGESDDVKAAVYGELFAAVISCWRAAWRDDLPFLFVQLAPFGKTLSGSGEKFPAVREQQEWVSKNIAKTYMVSIMDCGMKGDINHKHKRPVGERLALMARGKLYGEAVLCEPPELSGAGLDKGAVTLNFAHSGGGLILRGECLNALKIIVNEREIKNPIVQVNGGCIKIQSREIAEKSKVELFFAWEGYCEVNLYNSAGLAAKPFKWAGQVS